MTGLADLRSLDGLAGGGRHRGARPGQAHGRGAGRGRRLPGVGWPTVAAEPQQRAVDHHHRRRGTASSPRPQARSPCSPRPTYRPAAGPPGPRGAMPRRWPARRNVVDPLQLEPGDFVVHEQHGVGRFVEMMQREVSSATAARTRPASQPRVPRASSTRPASAASPADRLFVPTDQLDQVTRYVGGEAPDAQQDGRLRLGQDQGPGPQGRRQIAGRADPALLGADGLARATPSGRTPRGSASSRTPSPTSRPPTSSPPSTRSRPTWSGRSRWTG